MFSHFTRQSSESTLRGATPFYACDGCSASGQVDDSEIFWHRGLALSHLKNHKGYDKSLQTKETTREVRADSCFNTPPWHRRQTNAISTENQTESSSSEPPVKAESTKPSRINIGVTDGCAVSEEMVAPTFPGAIHRLLSIQTKDLLPVGLHGAILLLWKPPRYLPLQLLAYNLFNPTPSPSTPRPGRRRWW